MEKIRESVIIQIDREIKELENDIFKNTHLLTKLKNGKLIGANKNTHQLKEEIKVCKRRIEHLTIQKEEIKNNN